MAITSDIKNTSIESTTIKKNQTYNISAGGTATESVINTGGKQVIFQNGTATDTKINAGGSQIVSSGTVTGTVINKKGVEIVSGGTVTGTTINAGGKQEVYHEVSETTIAGGQQIIYDGAIAKTTTLNAGTQTVQTGGKASNTTVGSKGKLILSANATATNATVQSGGTLTVVDLDTGSSEYIKNLSVDAGGTINATLNKKTYTMVKVGSEGSLTNASIKTAAGGRNIVISGSAENLIVTGKATTSGDGAVILTGAATATGTQVSAGGLEYLKAGTTADGTVIFKNGQQWVEGTANNTVINANGSQVVLGGSAAGTHIAKNGTQIISAGNVTGTILSAGGIQLIAKAGATVSGTTGDTGDKPGTGSQFIYGGGSAANTTLNTGGVQAIYNGQATGTTVGTGAKLVIINNTVVNTYPDEAAKSVNIEAGGTVAYYENTKAGYTDYTDMPAYKKLKLSNIYTVNKENARKNIEAGAISGVTFSRNGNMVVGKNATTHSILIAKGGKQIVNDTTTNITDATVTLTSIGNGGVQRIEKGKVSGTQISKGGIQQVVNGTADSTQILKGGVQDISGGVVLTTTISKGGSQKVAGTGQADNTTIAGGIQLLESIAENTIINTGSQIIYNGGEANTTTVNAGGLQAIYKGNADGTTLNKNAKLAIIDDADATRSNNYGTEAATNVKGADQVSILYYKNSQDGKFDYSDLPYNKLKPKPSTLYTTAKTTGAFAGINFSRNGNMIVGDGATTTNLTIANGGVQIVNNANASDSEMVTGTTIKKGGVQRIQKGYVDSTTITNGALQVVSAGTVKNTTIAKGGIQVASGTADATTVKAGGSLVILPNVTMTGLNVDVGGLLYTATAVSPSNTASVAAPSSYFTNATLLGSVNKKGALTNVTYDGDGNLIIGDEATAKNYVWSGNQIVAGGEVTTTTLGSGATMTVDSGGTVTGVKVTGGDLIFTDGSGTNLNATAGSIQGPDDAKYSVDTGGSIATAAFSDNKLVLGKKAKANKVTVTRGTMNVSGGSATNITVSTNGIVDVTSSTVTSATVAAGKVNANAGAKINNATLAGGTVVANTDSVIKDITLDSGSLNLAGGKLTGNYTFNSTNQDILTGSGTWEGTKNTLTLGQAATSTSATTASTSTSTTTELSTLDLTLAGKNTTLNLAGPVSMKKLGGEVTTTTGFDISQSAATPTSPISINLLSTTEESALKSNFVVATTALQGLGNYTLTSNVALSGSLTVSIDGANVAAKSMTLNKNGVTYALDESGTLSLTPYASKNVILAGTKATSAIAGTADSDVLYGSNELSEGVGTNDIFDPKNGRDVVVYDSKAWGSDTIKKTNGTLTLVFNGVSESQITKTPSNGNLTISKNSDPNQTILIQGWNDTTHKITYAQDGMSEFDAWISEAAPKSSTAIQNARDEAWQKAGLIASA